MDRHTSEKTLNERICASGATPTSLNVGMILATHAITSTFGGLPFIFRCNDAGYMGPVAMKVHRILIWLPWKSFLIM
jgi:hypothetical protein